MRLTLQSLRRDLPEWAWAAVRDGFGWEYQGRKGGDVVTVRAHSVLVGDSDEDARTEWFVRETGQPYWIWCVRERTDLANAPRFEN